MTVLMKYTVSIRGDRDLWLEFIHKAKKEKKKAWEVLTPFLKKYSLADDNTRVLLILFPKGLVDNLLKQEDPDEFIGEAIRKYLSKEK